MNFDIKNTCIGVITKIRNYCLEAIEEANKALKPKEKMLIFKEKLPSQNREQIIAKINEVASFLNIDPNWLMAVINFESAGTFSTSIQNPYTNATGLIQFMPSTATSLGTSVTALKNMSFVDQLEYVKKYYTPYRTRIKGFVDLYLATFFPVALGKGDDFVLQTSNLSAQLIANQNPVFDKFPKDGKITVGEIKKVMLAKVPADYLQYLITQPKNIILGVMLMVAVLIIAVKANS